MEISMCDVAERLEKMGIAKGIELGREEGKAEEKKAKMCIRDRCNCSDEY